MNHPNSSRNIKCLCYSSPILRHLIESGQKADFDKAFNLFYELSKAKLIRFGKARGTEYIGCTICIQKQFIMMVATELNYPFPCTVDNLRYFET